MIASRHGRRKDPRLWYGWVVLAVVYLAMITLIAFRATIGPFFKEISGELGWSRGATAAAFSIGMLAQAVVSPLAGVLSDRWSIRGSMSAGVLVFGLSLLIGSRLDALWQFYLMYIGLCAGFAAGTWVAQVPTLSNWFVKKRGFALGVVNTAQGGAFGLNAATPWLIAALGWRMSYLALAGVILLFVLPVCALLHRDRPEDKNTIADAPFVQAPPGARETKPASPDGARVSLRSLSFFLFLGSFLPMAYAFAGMLVHLVPHATDQGFSLEAASVLFALWGLCQAGANLISPVSDRLGRTPTFLAGAAIGALSALVLAAYERGDPEILFYLGTIANGAALGLMRPTGSALLADYFEGPDFGRVNGVAMMGFALWGAAGPWATGALFDWRGSYLPGLALFGLMFFLCGLFALLLGWTKKDKRGTPFARAARSSDSGSGRAD